MKKPIIFLIAAMLTLTLLPIAAFGESIDQEPYRCPRENCTIENCQHGENCPYAIDGQGCNSACYVNSGEGAYCYRGGENNRRMDENTYHRGYRNNGGGHCRSFQYNSSVY